MSTEDNKATVRRFYEEVFNQKKLVAIDEFSDPSYLDHTAPSGLPSGIEGQKQLIGMYLTAFPDLHLTVEELIADQDKVVSRWSGSGTHQGKFLGIPPTGKQVTTTGMEIIRIAGRKFVEHWMELDALGLLQQLGIVPAPGQTS